MKGALDLRLLDKKFQGALITQGGLKSGDLKQRFSDVVLGLDFGRIEHSSLLSPITKPGKQKRNLTGCLDTLIKQGHLSDVIGAKVLGAESVLHYSTFVSPKLKPYFPVYISLMERICDETGIQTTVWLEDLMSLPRFGWSIECLREATLLTREWFTNQKVKVTIKVGSESGGGVVPLDFIEKTFGDCSMAEFMVMLPFHKHDMSVMSVSDVAHCLWGTYVFSCFPGLHLTAINSKRNYMLFRKLLGRTYSVALLPRIV